MTHSDEHLEISGSRLPKSVVPKHYDLTFTPNLADFTFAGSESIKISVKKKVAAIVINSAEIVISKAVLTDRQGKTATATVTYDEVNEARQLRTPHQVRRRAQR